MPFSCFRIRARPLTSGFGGAEGIRTPDLLIANETRYQLRHSPEAPYEPARAEKIPPGRTRSESRLGGRSGADCALLLRLGDRLRLDLRGPCIRDDLRVLDGVT